MEGPSRTAQLLLQWHSGDRKALEALLEEDLPWIESRVRRRLGPLLHAKAETADFVQEAAMEVLRYSPRFVLSSREQFRALLARIVENVLRDESDRFTAARRALHKERPLPEGTRIGLDGPADPAARPSQALEREEWEAWVRFGMELLDPEDRRVLLLRNWEGRSFGELGKELGISEDAARMRCQRAVARLAGRVQALRAGRLEEILEETDEPPQKHG